jgi:Zn-dependent M16 (insulinase) family peptidase
LTANIEETVYFPCDEEVNSNGIVAVSWRGPHITDMKQLIALDLLLSYLTDSTISPLQAHFIVKNSYCNKVKSNKIMKFWILDFKFYNYFSFQDKLSNRRIQRVLFVAKLYQHTN